MKKHGAYNTVQQKYSRIKQERGTASEPFPIDWHLAGVAFSCISQGKSPCRYHRRVAATKLTTSNAYLKLIYRIA